ncbi:MAG: response regulator transcription factor [candidate division KSB1 bacterium]|nr:response regulator transcription factor [candidate division KSB1 bacterium]MDQ7063694.1 response regulator transcription factor [candidate division KSB1 bacterium]
MRILVIEDEPGIADFLKEGLEEEYYAVDVAYDGKTGLEMALTNEYDLLLIDWMVPGVSGIEICRQVRKIQPDVPIIFLTARDTVEDTVFGLDSGANDYIKKPFQFEELLARIRVQLRPKTEKPQVLQLADLTMNLQTHQVFRGEEEIALTPREYALLEFLLRHQGQVCTRTRILEHVWDVHFDRDSSIIDVYINALRKKLNKNNRTNLIHTIHGVGYIAREP